MIQTLAIFLDAYRELNAKKMFWIVMILSGLVVAVCACFGISERGITFLTWTIENDLFNTTMVDPETFYKMMFASIAIPIWLTWVATILALISTSSIFPDLVSGGSIELVLSKPIGRWRLFLTKYAAALLFVVLQVLAFSGAAFLVIGIRGGAWEPALFLAVPVITLFFSYLFSVCTLLGIVTKSTIASLLLTMLVWVGIFAVHTTEVSLFMFQTRAEMTVERHDQAETRTEERLAELQGRLVELESAEELDQEEIELLNERIASGEEYLTRVLDGQVDAESNLRTLTTWHRPFYAAKTLLPKTAETVALLERWLVDFAKLPGAEEDEQDTGADPGLAAFFGKQPTPGRLAVSDEQMQERFQERIHKRSLGWVVGTSVAFEVFMLLIAGWIFARRDF